MEGKHGHHLIDIGDDGFFPGVVETLFLGGPGKLIAARKHLGD